MRPYPISAADHIVLEKIGGLELLEDAFNKQGAGPREGTGPFAFWGRITNGRMIGASIFPQFVWRIVTKPPKP